MIHRLSRVSNVMKKVWRVKNDRKNEEREEKQLRIKWKRLFFPENVLVSPFVPKSQVNCNIKLFHAFAFDYLLCALQLNIEHFHVYFPWKRKTKKEYLWCVISKHFSVSPRIISVCKHTWIRDQLKIV